MFVTVVVALGLIAFSDVASESSASPGSPPQDRPNIIFILADDLGYGDVGCYNQASKVPTPHLDRLAQQGIRFTDAHSPATVCTPTRYSLMTGRMAFRTGSRGVFTGAGGPCLIEEQRLTLPGMLQENGYATACFGKWHIGLTFLDQQGEPIHKGGLEAVKRIDYSRSIPDAPIHRGFDHFYGTACCPTTDWLYAYIEGDRIPVPPVALLDKSPLPKHPYARDNRRGMIAPNFDMENVDLVFLEKSLEFMRTHVRDHEDQPFFLFHSAQSVHLPSFPEESYKEKTEAGPHGDFIFELDAIVGEILRALDELGIAEKTLVMFSSDNGPETLTTVQMRQDHQHDPARPWRGMKRDQWEGGHRVPFIARWPDRIPQGFVSDQLISLTDVMATCAALVEYELPQNAAEDSFNILPALLGDEEYEGRPYLLQQTFGKTLSLRKGAWKYLDHRGSGGNNYQSDRLRPFALEENAPDAPGQLYDLDQDPGETRNVYHQHPDLVKELKATLEGFRKSGRSVADR